MADSADLKSVPRFKPGDILRHDHVNGITDALKRDLEVVGPGVRQSGRKVQISLSDRTPVELAMAKGSINAMSGNSPGQGTATPQWFNPATNQIEAAGTDIPVINVSRGGSGAIRNGQMCLIFHDHFGTAIIVAIEC